MFSGHSLGGAIAQLITMLLLSDEPKRDVKAIVFGSPPVFRRGPNTIAKYDELYEALQEKIVSFVNANDIVPSASIGTVKKLIKALRYVNMSES